MFRSIWKNLKTTLAGSIAGGTVLATGAAAKDPAQIITGIAVILLGLLSKDAPHTDAAVNRQRN